MEEAAYMEESVSDGAKSVRPIVVRRYPPYVY